MGLDVLTIGNVTSSTAKISFRMSQIATVRLDYGTDPTLTTVLSSTSVITNTTEDFTGSITISGLQPDTRYYFKLMENGISMHSSPFPTFLSFPISNTPVSFKFMFSSCYSVELTYVDTLFNTVNALAQSALPRFGLHLGDNMYGDQGTTDLSTVGNNVLINWRAKLRNSLVSANSPGYVGCRSKFSWHYTWDDHDLAVNDYNLGVGGATYNNARQTFFEYLYRGNPDSYGTGEIYHFFNYGNVGYYVLDLRSYRNAGTNTILGSVQKQRLKDWLLANKDLYPVKFIVSSDGVNAYGKALDSWKGFSAERNEIFDYIIANKIKGVFWLTGDEHYVGIFQNLHNNVLFNEFQTGPIRQDTDTLGAALNYEIIFKSSGFRNFGMVTVDTTVNPCRLTFDAINSTGQSLGTVTRTTNDSNQGIPDIKLFPQNTRAPVVPRTLASGRTLRS